MPKAKVLICPYCGETQPAGEQCRSCRGLFDSLSRQATHNAMGPWFIRDPGRPFRPGCSYETLVIMIERGQVGKNTVVRGPTTKQFWTVAKRTPGIAHLFAHCHHCDARVDPADHGCHGCGAAFGPWLDRDSMGLPEVRPMPWDADVEPGDTAPARMGPLGPPPSGRGMSSFATDEELFGHGSGPIGAAAMAPAPAPVATGVAPAPAPAPERATSNGGPETHADPAGAVTRAMQRRLARQDRQIRMLTMLLGAAVVLAGVLSVVQWRLMSTDEPELMDAGSPPAHDEPATAGPAEERSVEKPAAAPTALEAPAPSLPGVETGDGNAEIPAAADPDAPKPVDWSARYEEALALVETGADASVERGLRLEAYEKALKLLEDIAGNAPPSAQPPGLEALRERLARDLEQLRLEEFFGG